MILDIYDVPQSVAGSLNKTSNDDELPRQQAKADGTDKAIVWDTGHLLSTAGNEIIFNTKES